MTPAGTIQVVSVVGRRVAVGAPLLDAFTYSVVEPDKAERRGERRLRTRLREALVGERQGRPLIECRIRDLTRRGARLQLDKDRPLPKAFYLTEAGSGSAFWATLVWQVGRDAGVRLTPVG